MTSSARTLCVGGLPSMVEVVPNCVGCPRNVALATALNALTREHTLSGTHPSTPSGRIFPTTAPEFCPFSASLF
eukprot:6470144-Amphidinium_carterae.1